MEKGKVTRKCLLAITPFLWTSGEERGVRTVFETLVGYQKAGYDVHVMTLDVFKKKSRLYRGLVLHTFSIPFTSWIGNYGPFNSIFSYNISKYAVIRYLVDKLLWLGFVLIGCIHGIRLVKDCKPTIIYGFTSYGSPVAYFLGRIFRIPNVTRLLGTFLYPYIESVRFGNFGERLLGYVQLVLRFTEVLAFKWPAKALIITDDGTLGNKVAEFLGSRSPVFCWMNGFAYQHVDGQSVEELRNRLVKDEGDVVVIWAGQLIPWKRLDRWLQVAAYINERRANVRFVLLGDGRLRMRLEQLCTELGLSDKVWFKGAVDYKHVWQYFRAADVFMSCHDLTNACNTLFEAMICGLAIVTIRNGSTSHFISSKDAILIPPSDSESLIRRMGDAVIRLVDDRKLREKLRQASKAYASRKLFSWEKRIQNEIQVLESIVGLSSIDTGI
jgi:glycosyltransferase involved in cell wall biosynthesis